MEQREKKQPEGRGAEQITEAEQEWNGRNRVKYRQAEMIVVRPPCFEQRKRVEQGKTTDQNETEWGASAEDSLEQIRAEQSRVYQSSTEQTTI